VDGHDPVIDLPGLPGGLVPEIIRAITTPKPQASALLRLRAETRAALADYRRATGWGPWLRYHRASSRDLPVVGAVVRRLTPHRKKRPRSGGFAVAFVGADGAGKSSTVQEIRTWLGWRIDTRNFYMGNTAPSLGSRAVRAVGVAFAGGAGVIARVAGRTSAVGHLASEIEGLGTGVRHIADARDRYGRYLASRRAVGSGSVVVFDRYPLTGVRVGDHDVDGARIVPTSADGASASLARMERRLYERIAAPDVVVVLSVSPEEALRRKPGHREHVVRAKAEALVRDSGRIPNAVVVDAGQPLPDVLLEVKRIIWSRL
jgi:thymidylate kinase